MQNMNLLCAYYLWLSVRCTRYTIHSLIILVFRASVFLNYQSFLENPFFIGLLSCQCCTKAVGSQDDTGGKGGQEVSSSASPLGRASSELRPGCLELCPVKAWQSPRVELAQPCWEPVPLSSPVPPGERVSLSVLHHSSFSSIFLLCTAVKSLAPTPQSLPCRCWGIL